MVPLSTYALWLSDLEKAGIPVAGDNGHRSFGCTRCSGEVMLIQRDDGSAEIKCPNGCQSLDIASDLELKIRPEETTQALNAAAAAEELAVLLGLTTVSVKVLRPTVTGQGSRASAEIPLDNGDTMEFESLREMANPTILAAELAACAGVTEPVTKVKALSAVAVLRRLAQRNRTITDNDLATDWGLTYLQSMPTRDVDLQDQRDRWEAFADLRSMDHARSEGGYSGTSLVLVDRDGQRYVRTGHFYAFVKSRDGSASEAKITARMLRVGWYKRNASGRIKATSPHMPEVLGWNFFVVPEDWPPGSRVHAGREVTRAHEHQLHAVRNPREPVNPGEAA